MALYDNNMYLEDLKYITELEFPWDKLKGKKILVSGATGLVGSFLIDALMMKNEKDLQCSIFALSRNADKAQKRFSKWKDSSLLHLISHDINESLVLDTLDKVDYTIHLASNTHPLQYSTDPIGTIKTNIIGLQNMLDFSIKHNSSRFVFTSSVEVYGENRGDAELFEEGYCGYIDCNTVRAGYPESKRCGEALCQAYRAQNGLDIVIPRLTRSYGPTMLSNDTKAMSQFILKAISNQDIVLKSSGNQFYSYTYVADAVAGLLYVMFYGKNGEAYNIADEKSDITLKALAELIASFVEKKVIFDLPNEIEAAGYSKATKARLDGSKLKNVGWYCNYDIKSGVERTISILKSLQEE